MKKILSIVLSALLVLGLVGCSGALHNSVDGIEISSFNASNYAVREITDGTAGQTDVVIKIEGLANQGEIDWNSTQVGVVGSIQGWNAGATTSNVAVSSGAATVSFSFTGDEAAQIQVIEANAGWNDGKRPIGDANMVIPAMPGKCQTFTVTIK